MNRDVSRTDRVQNDKLIDNSCCSVYKQINTIYLLFKLYRLNEL